ncbi:MAG TPA: hypothetical protein VKA97_07785 [Pyrinomonadaceae bacterium]|nr:hypothetical protein [Pyrinomonadaceae bacterium]
MFSQTYEVAGCHWSFRPWPVLIVLMILLAVAAVPGTVAAQPIPKVIRAPDVKVRPVFGEQIDGALRQLSGEGAVLNRSHADQLLEFRFERLDEFSELRIHYVHYPKTANARHHPPARAIELHKSRRVAGQVQ